MVLAADNLLDFSLKYFAEYQKMVGGSCVMWYFEEQLDNLRKTGVGHIENGKLVRMVEKPIAPLDKCAIPPFYIYSTDSVSYTHLHLNRKSEVNYGQGKN